MGGASSEWVEKSGDKSEWVERGDEVVKKAESAGELVKKGGWRSQSQQVGWRRTGGEGELENQ